MDQNIKKERREYSESFRRKVIEEYLQSGVSKMSLLKKYDIRSKSAIQKWMRQLGYVDIHQKKGSLPLINTIALSAKKKQIPSPSESAQEARIKELERLLEDEQLRSEAYLKMIDIAEREFSIPIRKKPSTK